MLTVSDLNRQNYFTMRANTLPAMDATKEQFASVRARINGHQKHVRAIYGDIQHPKVSTITRDADATSPVSELGRFHIEETERFKEEMTTEKRTVAKIHRAADAAGIALPAAIRNPERVLEGVEMERAWREESGVAPAPANLTESGGKKSILLNRRPVRPHPSPFTGPFGHRLKKRASAIPPFATLSRKNICTATPLRTNKPRNNWVK
jgi:hypothetical protein